MVRFYLLFLFASLMLCNMSFGIDIDQVNEFECSKPHKVVARNVDFAWMLSVNRWYIPLQSKSHFYRLCESLLQKPLENITDSEVPLNSSCITWKLDSPFPNPKIFGFIDKNVNYITTPVLENTYAWKGTGENDKRGRTYISLKDNKTFVFFTNCWEDGQATWNVVSTSEKLEASTRETILQHVKSMGFNEELIVQQDYSKCPPIPIPLEEDPEITTKNEL